MVAGVLSKRPIVPVLGTLVLLGIGIRFWLSWNSVGSNDVVNWFHSAQSIASFGLVESYRTDQYLNNPPTISWLVSMLLWVSDALVIPFPFLLRCLGILGEVLSAGLLIAIGFQKSQGKFDSKYSGWFLAGVFALNPLSILVTGFHGHTDGLCGALAFLAFYVWTFHRDSFWSGFCLGLSMNVKLIPLLLGPALIFSMPDWKQRFMCCVGGALACVFFFIMYFYGGQDFYQRVFGYRSILDYWGFQTFLLIGSSSAGEYAGVFDALSAGFQASGPYLILGSVTVLNLIYKAPAFDRALMSYCIFAILAPGFGITYPSLFMPFFCVVSLWWGVLFSVVNALTLLAVYSHFQVSSWPFQTVHVGSSPRWAVLGMFLMWIMLLWFVVEKLIAYRKQIRSENRSV